MYLTSSPSIINNIPMHIPPPSYNCYFNPFDKQIHYLQTSTVPWMIQVGCFYDICFRLADSVSQTTIRKMTDNADYLRSFPSHDFHENAINERYITLAEIWANRGYGECLLRIPGVRDIVAQEILSYNEIECQIGAFVIMGNHIHLILKMLGLYSPYDLITKIKNNSARDINKLLGRTGRRWMQGEYNHLIRSPADLRRRLKYLKENPNGISSIPVYERPDNIEFAKYITPLEEKATQQQIDYYWRIGW